MWLVFRSLKLSNKNQSLKLSRKLVNCSVILGVFRLREAPSWLQSVGVMVEKEACKCRVVDIIRVDSIVVPIPIHLEPDLVSHL